MSRQLVLGVDDAHLLDDASAFVIRHMVREQIAAFVLTIRSDSVLPQPIQESTADPAVLRLELELELEPLPLPNAEHLIEYALRGAVESASAAELWRYTGGNVMYLRSAPGR
jgi:hypothetical protein